MKMGKFPVVLLIVALACLSVSAAKRKPAPPKYNPWQISYEDALKQAKDFDRPVMICFLGSDWCPYCIKLLKEVLDTRDFGGWAMQNLVVMVADYPKKITLPPEMIKRNDALKEKFNVHGFPQVVLVAADGSELGRIGGYSGKEKWQAQLRQGMEKGKAKP